MSIQEMGLVPQTPLSQWSSHRKRKRLIKLGIGCLAIFVVGFLVMSAVAKIQDMSDRAQ